MIWLNFSTPLKRGSVERKGVSERQSEAILFFHMCVNGFHPITYNAWSKGNCDQSKLGVQRRRGRWGCWCPHALSLLFSQPAIPDPFCKQKLLWRNSWLWLSWHNCWNFGLWDSDTWKQPRKRESGRLPGDPEATEKGWDSNAPSSGQGAPFARVALHKMSPVIKA